MIRVPDFISDVDLDWAVSEATRKKKKDFSDVRFIVYEEGLCVQCMHIGPFDRLQDTIDKLELYACSEGLIIDVSKDRPHHEIYMSDFRKVSEDRYRTVVRLPVRNV